MTRKILFIYLFTTFTLLIAITTAAQDTTADSWTRDTAIARQWLEEGENLMKERKFESALIKLDSAALVYTASIGEQSLEYAQVLNAKNKLFYQQNQYDKAIEYSEQALKIRLNILGEMHLLVADSYHNLGIAYSRKRAFDKAIEYDEKALQVRLKILGTASLGVADLYSDLGILYKNKRQYDIAFQYHEKSLQIRLKILGNEHPNVATSYYNMGDYYVDKEQYDLALQNHKKALQIRLKILGSEHPSVGHSYNNLARIYYEKAQYDTVVQYYQKALQILLKNSNESNLDVAFVYNNLANTYNKTGDYDIAIEYNKKALQIKINKLGYIHSSVLGSYYNLGIVHAEKGEYDQAISCYEKAIDIASKLTQESNESLANSYNKLGDVYRNKADYDRAIEYCNKALQIQSKLFGETHSSLSNSYNSLGGIYNEKREPDHAIIYLQKALQIRLKNFGDAHPNTAIIYNNLGNAYGIKGDYNQSIQCNEKALQIRLKVFGEIHSDVATSYNNLGNAYDASKNFDQALEYFKKALQIRLQTLGDIHPRVGGTYYSIGLLYIKKGEYNSAISYLKKSLDANQFEIEFLDKVPKLSNAIYALSALGEVYRGQYEQQREGSYLSQAKVVYNQAFKAIDFQQNTFSEAGSKENLAQSTQPVYEGAIQTNQLLHQTANDISLLQESFTFAERSKAFLLYGALQEANALQFAGLPEDLLQQEYDLRVDITYHEKRRQDLMSKGTSETDTTVLAISGKLFDLKQQYEVLKKRFETEYPDYYRLKYDLTTVSAEEVQRDLLQPNQALLEYFVGDSSLFLFVLRPDTLVMQEVKKDFPLEDWVKSLRENIYQNRTTGATAYTEAAYNLYQKLILPIKSLLPEQVIIIPDGILGYVPFEALLTAKPERAIRFNSHAYLLKEHQISYCYSATLLREMQQKKRVKTPAETLLAVAPFYTGDTTLLASLFAYDETTRKDLAPLQHSGEEVYRIGKLWKGEVLTGADATEEKFTSQAGNYRILHLATHGRADERVGDYSFLAFSEIKDSVENELLYVRDLYNLQLNADLVVLSACETGLGKLNRGEGIISLARAFAYAGAKSIVTTLWSVDDAKTKDLMVDFYRKLKKGMTKDEALRHVKLDYLQSHPNPGDAHPFYWAGFALIGDSKPLR